MFSRLQLRGKGGECLHFKGGALRRDVRKFTVTAILHLHAPGQGNNGVPHQPTRSILLTKNMNEGNLDSIKYNCQNTVARQKFNTIVTSVEQCKAAQWAYAHTHTLAYMLYDRLTHKYKLSSASRCRAVATPRSCGVRLAFMSMLNCRLR